ncbi:MAG TPA: diguanylate cyclase [Fibrobacteraceae bacterium]|nr:diguanylate cyclase [Fibrobacteraceae bacterium]
MKRRFEKLKLTWKVGLLYFVMNVVSISLFTYVITSNQASLISDNTRYQAKDLMSLLVQNLRKLSELDGNGAFRESERLDRLDSTLRRLTPSYVVFRGDSILRRSQKTARLDPDHRECASRAEYLREFNGMDYYLRMKPGEHVLVFYVPLDEFGISQATLATELKVEDINKQFYSMYKLIGFTVLALTLLHLAFAYLIFRMLIRPILSLYRATLRVSRGDYDEPVDLIPGDELGALAEGFNHMMGQIKNTVEQLNSAKLIAEKASHSDALTGLFNRRYVFPCLEKLVADSVRQGTPLSVVLIDVDHFKKVNDSYGHQAGDLVLREIAACLRDGCRSSDVLARYGGEEILMVLPNTQLDQAVKVAQKQKDLVASRTMILPDGQNLHVTISLGVAEFQTLVKVSPELPVPLSRLLEYADVALYQAKNSGRNRVAVMNME